MDDAASAAHEDLYELFEIDSDSDADEIRTTLRATRKRWRQQTGSPDLERRRRAETWMDRIGRAEEVLLDPGARAEYDEALAAQSRAGASTPHSPRSASGASTNWGGRAEQYLGAEDPRNALRAAKRGTEVDPDDTTSWLMYTRAAEALEQYDDADFASAELLHRVPNVANLQYRADLLDRMGRPVDAEKFFRQAVQRDSGSAYLRARAAWAVLDQGRIDEAIAEAWSVVESFPDDEFPPRVLRVACARLREQKQPAEALSVAERLLDHEPDVDATLLEAVISVEALAEHGQSTVALSHSKRLFARYPDSEYTLTTMRFVTQKVFEAGGTDVAVEQAWALRDRFPADDFPPKLLWAACERFRGQNRPQQALQIGQRLLRARPGVDENMRQTVLAIEQLAALGEIGTAIASAWLLLDAHPEAQRPRLTMSFLISKLCENGQPEEALAQARELLSRFPEDVEVRRRYAWARLLDADAKLAKIGPDSIAILNTAQAEHYGGAITEVESMGLRDADIARALATRRAYHAEQMAVSVKGGCWTIAGAIVSAVLVLIGLSELWWPGFLYLAIGGLLVWAIVASAVRRKYQRDARTWPREAKASRPRR